MRKVFSAVAVGALALGFSACSQDVAGPSLEAQFSKRSGDEVTTTSAPSAPGCPGVILDDATENAKANNLRQKCSSN